MEIVIENPTDLNPTTPTPNYGTLPGPNQIHRPFRLGQTLDGPVSPNFYGTLPPRGRLHPMTTPQPDFDVATTVRRVDKSGLLEIVEPEPPRCRPRNLTGAETGASATLNRRIDRSGLLEAVPEVPDQLQSQKNHELSTEELRNRSTIERHLTGAEIDQKDQNFRSNLSPRTSLRSTLESNTIDRENLSIPVSNCQGIQSSSPYFRRAQISPLPENSNSLLLGNNISNNTKFGTLESRGQRQQAYVDLTGATYTRACANSPIMVSSRATSAIEEIKTTTNSGEIEDSRERILQQQHQQEPPDCLGKLSPRSRQSPLTVSSIPDVIEAHGSSRIGTRSGETGKVTPEGERAEAEGCEHTAIESLEETRVSFKASNKLLRNDNIQTLRVIILSEPL